MGTAREQLSQGSTCSHGRVVAHHADVLLSPLNVLKAILKEKVDTVIDR